MLFEHLCQILQKLTIIIYFYRRIKKMNKAFNPMQNKAKKNKLRLSPSGRNKLQIIPIQSQLLTPNNASEIAKRQQIGKLSSRKLNHSMNRRISMFQKENVNNSQIMPNSNQKKFVIRSKTPLNKKKKQQPLKKSPEKQIQLQLLNKKGVEIARQLMRRRTLLFNKSNGIFQIKVFDFYQLFDKVVGTLNDMQQQKIKWSQEANKFKSFFQRIDFQNMNQNCDYFDRTLEGKLKIAQKRIKTLLYINKKLQENKIAEIEQFHKKILSYNPSVQKQLTETIAKANAQIKVYKRALQFFKDKFKSGGKNDSFDMIFHQMASIQRQTSLINSLLQEKKNLNEKIYQIQTKLQKMSELQLDIENLKQKLNLAQTQIKEKSTQIQRLSVIEKDLYQKLASRQQQISKILKQREQDQYKIKLMSKIEQNLKLKDEVIKKHIKTINELQTRINLLNSRIQCNTEQSCSIQLTQLGKQQLKKKGKTNGILKNLNMLDNSLTELQKQKEQQIALIRHFINNLVIAFENLIKQYREQTRYTIQQCNQWRISFDRSTQKLKKIDQNFQIVKKKLQNFEAQEVKLFQSVGGYNQQYGYEKLFGSFNKIYFISKQKGSMMQDLLNLLK